LASTRNYIAVFVQHTVAFHSSICLWVAEITFRTYDFSSFHSSFACHIAPKDGDLR